MRKLIIVFASLLFIGMHVVYAQTTISGNVTDTEGQPLPGVSISAKGSTVGTISDLNGKFSINMPEGTNILIFSFTGLQTQEVVVGDKTIFDVVMNDDDISISEVVVVGYGSQIKSEMTGSVLKVEGKEISSLPVPTLEGALQGKTAGVYIASSSGKLGEGIKVRVRGSSSISADNQPLYVVDGVVITSQSMTSENNSPTNPLADINPNDIESISILKDAAGAAIYGSRASNGVVIITTKQGKKGATKMELGYQIGFSNPAHKMEMMNGPEYYQYFHEVFARSYGEADADAAMMENIPTFTDGYDTDWQDLAFQKGGIQQINFSTSGGNENTQFYVGLTYNEQKGILLGNSLNRFSGRLNLSHKAFKILNIGMNMGITNSRGKRVSNDNAFATPLQMIALPPVQPAYDPETGEIYEGTIYYNALIENRDATDDLGIFRNIGNAFAELDILKGLKFKSSFGLDLLNQREDLFGGSNTQDGAPTGTGSSRAVQVIKTSIENYFSYNKEFNNALKLNSIIGMSYESTNNQITSIQAKGFPGDDFKTIANAAETTYHWSSIDDFTYLSYFIRGELNLKTRYLFSGSVRMDGSSRFGANNKYGIFPATSFGWIISNEKFLHQSKTLSFLKLRASYGLTGNSEIGNFPSLHLYNGSSYNDIPGVRPAQLPSPDLKWETTAQYNIGLDFGMFNNRLSGELDYYFKKTKDLLLDKQLPATSGFVSIVKNVGKLENKGFEFVINSSNLVGKFTWTSSLNMAFNKNKITDLDGQPINTDFNRVEEGHELGEFYMRKYAGVDPANGDALYYISANSDATTNDYNMAQEQYVGSPNPDFVGGINNSFSYSGFDLQFMFQFVYGNSVFRQGGHWQSSNGYNLDNQTVDQLDAWQKPGDITDVPRADWDVNNGTRYSSRYLEDGSYLRFKSVSLGYNLPTKIISRLKLSNVRVYATAVNLYTWTKYKGMDPEVSFQGTGRSQLSQNIIQGVDFYTTPQARTITFGINIGI